MNAPSSSLLSSRPSGDRALVLGGGGSTGNAWLIGVIAGLAAAGTDVTAADLIVGTSAGATAAAQIACAAPADLLAAVLAADAAANATRKGAGSSDAAAAARSMAATAAIIEQSADVADMRRRLGRSAIERDADGAYSARWRRTVAARLVSNGWPTARMLITAVDADSGEPIVFDRTSGVSIVDAVAASCSSGLAYRIDDRRFIDGGYRCNENADLASGYDRVLVLSPFGGRSRHPRPWGTWLAEQVDGLRRGGSSVRTIVPDSVDLAGAGAMDASLRGGAARRGRDQGLALAAEIADFWR